MRNMKIDDKYRILLEDEKFPVEIDQKDLDEMLVDLQDILYKLKIKFIKYFEEDDAKIQVLKELLRKSTIDFDDGKIWKLNFLITNILELQNDLKSNDDIIPSYEDLVTIEDLGYTNHWNSLDIYQYIIEDSDEKEVVKEIILTENPIYRERTTIWEKTDYGKKSVDISYKSLDIDDNLMKAINNTKKNNK